MKQALLLRPRLKLVVGAENVADQGAPEYFAQYPFDDGRPPRFVDDIVTKVFVGETPQPVGDPIYAPAGFVKM